MATVVSTKAGNWSDPTVWSPAPPQAGDMVQAFHIIDLDMDVDIGNGTLQSAYDGAYGYFRVTTARTIVANIGAGPTSSTRASVHLEHNAPDVVNITGNIDGGTTNSSYGVSITGTGVVNIVGNVTGGQINVNNHGVRITAPAPVTITGTVSGGNGNSNCGVTVNSNGTFLTVNGTVRGGSGSGSLGINNSGNADVVVNGDCYGGYASSAAALASSGVGRNTINGNCIGGSSSDCCGAVISSPGTLTVNGDATGGAGNRAYGINADGGTTVLNGAAIGNNFGPGGDTLYSVPGVYGGIMQTLVTVRRVRSGPYGSVGIGGCVLLSDEPETNQAEFRLAWGGATRILADPAVSQDPPAEADVRNGVSYLNGNRTGSCHVPAPESVAYGVPVDATTGLAVLTAAQVREFVGTPSSGARTVTRVVKDSVTGDVLAGALVRYTLGVKTYVDTSDSHGVVTFNLDDGEWLVAATLSSYSYAGGTHNVSADVNSDLLMDPIIIAPIADPDQCVCYLRTCDGQGAAQGNIPITFSMIVAPTGSGVALDSAEFTATSNPVTGVLEIPLVRRATYYMKRETGRWQSITIPDADTYELPSLIG